MKITKLGHACLLVEEKNKKILIDPGSFSGDFLPAVDSVDVVLITHEHQDHIDPALLKPILAKNPGVRVFTNSATGKVLEKEGIAFELLEHGQKMDIGGVSIEGYGEHHAIIHPDIPVFMNTCYLIAGRLFHPGDSLTVPPVPVEILALPTAAPWLKIAEAIDYARAVKPKKWFSIHDGMLKDPLWMAGFLAQLVPNSEFVSLKDGASIEV